jgi:histidinol-phosphatase
VAERELHELLEFALELVGAAEPVILSRYHKSHISYKPDGSEVTDADRQAEEVMRELIARRCPDHAVLGEEFGPGGAADATWQWVLDPIDGTASFTLGIPLFGTLVGLLHDGAPVVGVVHLPVLGETLYAARGTGCWSRKRRGKAVPARVGAVRVLGHAVVLAPSGLSSVPPEQRDYEFRQLLPVMRRARKFRFGGDCLQHVLVCRGVAHAAIDPVMHPWDIAALVPCVVEAGGAVATREGRREDVVFGGSLVSCCTEDLLRDVLDVLGSRLSVEGPRTSENREPKTDNR